MDDSLDYTIWLPPAPQLSVGEIQRGVAPVTFVRNERASDPFEGEFDHWSTLPALSYFALNAVILRESLRRLSPPTTFRPPPRLTLSDQRREAWLNELKNSDVSLRRLSRAIPHGYMGKGLLDVLIEKEIPIPRAIWFIKCVGANEVRALKRKIASEERDHKKIESEWLSDWTQSVIQFALQIINSFDTYYDDLTGVDPENRLTDSTEEGHDSNKRKKSSQDNSGRTKVPKLKAASVEETSDGKASSQSPDSLAQQESDSDTEGNDMLDELFVDEDEVLTEDVSQNDTRTGIKEGSLQVWQSRMKYTSAITLSLYNASLVDRFALLTWIMDELCKCSVDQLPCYIHLVHLLWKPMTSSSMAPRLIRSLASRYTSATSGEVTACVAAITFTHLEPLVFKLMSTNQNAFITPRTWPMIEPHVRSHQAYSQIAARNQAFMPHDSHDPRDWSQQLLIGNMLNSFARPYQLEEIYSNLVSLEVGKEVLVRTILLRTLRQGTIGAITLCIALLKRLSANASHAEKTSLSEFCVSFLMDPHLIHGSECLGALIGELVKARLCRLDRYINKLISLDILHKPEISSGSQDFAKMDTANSLRELHLRILQDLPYDLLPSNLLTQVRTMLWRAGVRMESVALEPFIRDARLTLSGKQSALLRHTIRKLRLNDSRKLANRLIELFEELCESNETMPADLPSFTQFCDLMETLGSGSVRPLFKILVAAVSSVHVSPAIVSSALRQVHIRLMAFKCSGLLDPFVKHLLLTLNDRVRLSRLKSNRDQEVFQWVSWDDISALRAVITSPNIMCELNSVVPLRQTQSSLAVSAGQTPVERDACVKIALYKPGCPDINTLLAMRGDEGLSHDIAEWAQSPGADRTALLQLLTYHAVTLKEIVGSSADKFRDLRFFLLAPSSEMGFCPEEIEALNLIRFQFLKELPLENMLDFIASAPPVECISRIAHVYPDFFINDVVLPAMRSPRHLQLLRKATGAEMREFEVLLLRCTPFNLRFYQGLALLAFHDMAAVQIADEILRSAHAHPEASPALQGLLQYIGNNSKNLVFTKTVEQFLSNGLEPDQLPRIDVHFTLVGVLASSVKPHVQWSLASVPRFLKRLIKIADSPEANYAVMRKALLLLLRVSVIARLHDVTLPAEAAPLLQTLLHIQAFADSFKMRTIIEDALRLLLRISRKSNDERHAVLVNEDENCLSAGPSAMDGLRVYSKSRDHYDQVPVWGFDLIEDANPSIGKNDGPIDLSLFETYED